MRSIDDLLKERNITDYKSIILFSCYNENLTSLDGIEKLINLETLYCYNNKLSKLDLNKNINLQYLDCDNNQLTSIDLSKNIKLKKLFCDNNKLSSINLSNNINLEIIFCSDNKLNIQDLYQQISNNKTIKIINGKSRQNFLSDLKHKIVSSYKTF